MRFTTGGLGRLSGRGKMKKLLFKWVHDVSNPDMMGIGGGTWPSARRISGIGKQSWRRLKSPYRQRSRLQPIFTAIKKKIPGVRGGLGEQQLFFERERRGGVVGFSSRRGKGPTVHLIGSVYPPSIFRRTFLPNGQ